MDDPFESDFYTTIDRVTSNPQSFSGMLEYFQHNKPKEWLKAVELMMAQVQDHSRSAQQLGVQLGMMVNQYSEFMENGSEL